MFLESLFVEPTKDNLMSLVWIYVSAIALLFVVQWRSKNSVGLAIVYVFSYSIIHLIAAYVYTIPEYTPKSDILLQMGHSLQNTLSGFRVATFGLLGLIAGVLICPFIFPVSLKAKNFLRAPAVTSKLPGTLIVISLLSFFILAPIFRRIPSLGSMATAGTAVSVIGVFFYCWQAFHQKNTPRFLFGLLGVFVFPFLTIVFTGFASYGAAAAASICMMVVHFYRPRLVACVVLLICLYGGLTFYANWMMHRDEIRASVWGERTLSVRLEQASKMIDDFELLNTGRHLHLEIIDGRLNQNDLVGKAYRQLQLGRVEYANGYTMLVAAVAWVPRIFWPGKPATGGSGQVVSHFTGQKFAEGTSVGAGQALEFFVNFGWYGEFFGFLVLGLLIRYVDERAGFYLMHQDYWSCARWLLPGIGLMQPGGLLAELTGSFAAFAVFGYALHQMFFKQFYEFGDLKLNDTAGRNTQRQPNCRRYS